MIDMVFYKSSDKEIAVIVTSLEAQCKRMPCILAGLLQHDRFQLWTQKIIILALVHKDM